MLNPKCMGSFLLIALSFQFVHTPCAAQERAGTGWRPESGKKRKVVQFLSGALAGGTTGMLTAIMGSRLVNCDDCGPEDPECGNTGLGWGILLLGAPAVSMLTNSATVYFIGRDFDQEERGSYLATLGGTLGGAALTAGITYVLCDGGIDGGDLVGPAIAMSIVLPSVGSVVGYHWSKPERSGALSIEDGRMQWSLPRPALRLKRSPEGRADFSYGLRLVSIRF